LYEREDNGQEERIASERRNERVKNQVLRTSDEEEREHATYSSHKQCGKEEREGQRPVTDEQARTGSSQFRWMEQEHRLNEQ